MIRRPVMLMLAVLIAGSRPASAQQPAADGVTATRAELDRLLATFDGASRSAVYSDTLRARARGQAQAIRSRLERGDFQVGDRVLLAVEGEPSLTDSFTVAPGPALMLPLVGRVPLQGVLRSELDSQLLTHVARFIREPAVQVRSTIGLSIAGAVGRPGYYPVPEDALLSEALMLAGGPAPTAQVNEIRVERGGMVVDGAALREAVSGGRTVKEAGLRTGDRIVVPERGSGLGGAESAVRTFATIVSLPAAIFAIVQIFR